MVPTTRGADLHTDVPERLREHPPLELVDPVFDPCPVCDQAVTSVHFDGLDSGAPFTWVGPCEHRVQNSSATYDTVATRTYDLTFRHFTYDAYDET